jgi:shikimate dehydrogenase
MKRFGLVGYPLGHSYSKRYFENKFRELDLVDHVYELFEMEYLKEFPALWLRYQDLCGVNVTVPHKEHILKYLDQQDLSAIKVGAVNVVHKQNGKLKGYNTDYLAFKESLVNWLVPTFDGEALVLGSGGASKAVQASLIDLDIPFSQVSRFKSRGDYTYDQLNQQPQILDRFRLIINTTPLGMFPKGHTYPELPFNRISSDYYLYDLVYNPEETIFMQWGKEKGAKVKNGYEMLVTQAEKSWEIWGAN